MLRKNLVVVVGSFFTLCIATLAQAQVHSRAVDIADGSVTLKGQVFFDAGKLKADADGKLPAVIVVHEWWGRNDYALRRAKMVAELGYVGFAADMFGDAQTSMNPEVAGKMAGSVMGDPAVAQRRIKLIIDAIRALPEVDAKKVAMTGFCFGGSVSLMAAYAGHDLSGITAFHSSLPAVSDAQAAGVKAPILVLHGDVDPLTPPDKVKAFEAGLAKIAGYKKVTWFAGAEHAFTNPDADAAGIKGVKYDAKADVESWKLFAAFLADAFAGKLK